MKVLLILFVGSLWLAFGSYILWFFFRAKTVQPLTLDDLALTWNVHKQQCGCNASRALRSLQSIYAIRTNQTKSNTPTTNLNSSQSIESLESQITTSRRVYTSHRSSE
jgi:hypothetical protein